MQKIIKGKMYDTETATEVARYYCNYEDGMWYKDVLYQKKNGEYFIYGIGGYDSKYSHYVSDRKRQGGSEFIPLDEDGVKDWLGEHDFVDLYIELFGQPEE